MSRRDLDAALEKVQPRWSDVRAATTQRGVARKLRRRRTVRVALAVIVLLGVVAVGVKVSGRAQAPVVATPQPIAEAPKPPPLPSVPPFELTAEGARAPTLVDGVLVAGRVKLRGTGSLKAGPVEVVVSTSQVLVERTDVTVVTVLEGEAVVRWEGQEVRLHAGDERTFPPPAPVNEAPTRRPRPVAKWKQLAEEGDFATAWVELSKAQPPKDEPAELLLAADVARLSKHPQDALVPLRRVVARFPRDPRAPLASFTLGRTLLDELGRPAEAAQAFARARSLEPDGPLVPDALAREVEAEARAGNAGRARTLALEYLQRYPEGARARLVRHHGGIE